MSVSSVTVRFMPMSNPFVSVSVGASIVICGAIVSFPRMIDEKWGTCTVMFVDLSV